MQALPQQLDQQGHQRKHKRGQHQKYDTFQVIGQTMEPVQVIQPFARLEAVTMTFPLRKRIADPDGWAALSPIPVPIAKKTAEINPVGYKKKGQYLNGIYLSDIRLKIPSPWGEG